MDTMLIKTSGLIAIILMTAIISLAVYKSKSNSLQNKLFVSIAICIMGWLIFAYFASIDSSSTRSTIWSRLNFGFVSIFMLAAYLFVINFLKRYKVSKILNYLAILVCVVLVYFSVFTPLVVASVVKKSWGNEIVYGSMWNYFVAICTIYASLFIYFLIKKYKNFNQENKNRTQYFIVGILIYFFSNLIFNVIINQITGSNRYDSLGDYSAVFFIIFTAYAIMKHQLFNIKVVATEAIVIMLSLGLIVEVCISNTLTEGLLKAAIWVLATYGGYVLIKSVQVEIKQKEQLARLATKLNDANEHLKELDETKDNFLSMASHELNTPIAAINGYLSMIIDEKMCGPMNADMTRYLTQVYTSSRRLAALVKDLLNVSRIESNRIHIIYTDAQIEDIITQSVAEVAIKAKEAGHKLTFEKPEHKLPKTFMDVPRITEVMINLLGNAIKYTDAPGKIVVRAHADSGKIVVAVEDNGRGIPKDKYDHVFEKFTQVNVLKDEVKGTGLGMFISKNLIEMHKGKLWFKSSIDEKNHGTTFYFSLPIHKEKPYDPHEGEGALFATKTTAPSASETDKLKEELEKTLGGKNEKKVKDENGNLMDHDMKKIMEAGMAPTIVHKSALKAIEKGKETTEKASTEWS